MQHDPKQTAILTYLSLYAAPCAAWMDGEADAASLTAQLPAAQLPLDSIQPPGQIPKADQD